MAELTGERPRLRNELLVYEDAGGCQVVDLLLEATHRFDPDEAAVIEALRTDGELVEVPAGLLARLQGAMLLEGPIAEALRGQAWAARIRRRVELPPLPDAPGPWHVAGELPEWIAPDWRTGERWRRLAEDAAGGRAPLRLDGFVIEQKAREIGLQAGSLAMTRLDNDYCNASCHGVLQDDGPLGEWAGLLVSEPLRALVGAVLRLALPERLQANVWRLEVGDQVGPHADGIRYVATMSLGLCEGWTARHGGAIAFGEPRKTGFSADSRWLPHRGDVLLFRPEAWGWHAVEPVQRDVRLTLTCQWIGSGGRA